MSLVLSCAGRMLARCRQPLLRGIAGAALAVPAISPAAQAPATAAQSPELAEVVVTGEMMPDAVVGDVPPENQMSQEEIAARGVSTISDLLEDIAEQTQSDQGRDGGAAPIILVNGRRVSGVREVGDLPTESILRLDILPEEVALKYGYGAEQKVVNIILKRDFSAQVGNLTAAESTQGGGANGTGDLSHSRIHDNERVNVVGRVRAQAAILESDRGVSSTASTISDPTGTLGDDSSARTLKPANNTYTLNSVIAHPLSQTVNASFNATASYQTNSSLHGYPSANLNIPAGSPIGQKNASTTLQRYLSGETLRQSGHTGSARAGFTLNAELPKRWRLSVVGSYDYSDARTQSDRTYDVRTLQAAISAGQVSPYGPLPASLLGPLGRQDSTAITNAGHASVVANGTLFTVPAGNVTTSIRLGDDFSHLHAVSTGAAANDTQRNQFSGQVSVSVPLTSMSAHVLEAIGNLSVNVTSAVKQVSGYGTLGTLGYGLHWTPRTGISLLASVNQDQQVPTLGQLNGPLVTNSNARIYDYVQGRTVTVSRISGGNPALKADDRRVFKLGATLAAISTPTLKLNFTANYIDTVVSNPIGSLNTATAVSEDAFPDRFQRDTAGMLYAVDARPVNFARQESESVRWGFNMTRVLRATTQAAPASGRGGPGLRNAQRSAGGAPGGARNARAGAPVAATRPSPAGDSPAADVAADAANAVDRESDEAGPSPTGPARSGAEEGGSGERPGPDAGFGPPMGSDDAMAMDGQQRGGGGRPDGGGATGPSARASARSGGGASSGGGGGGGGGGGSSGGGRGGSRGGGGSSAGNGAQFDVSLYHSWYFRNEVRLRAGGPTIDLLNGGTLGAKGQARHRLQLNSGVMDNGIGLRFTGNWTSAISILDRGDGTGALNYSSLGTLDVRLFGDLQLRYAGKWWAQGTRVTLAVTNVFDSHQHIRDASGATPQIYQPAFLDPTGRSISLAFRRLF